MLLLRYILYLTEAASGVLLEKVFLKISVFTEERLCWSLFLIKLQALRLIFPAMFLKTPILKSICTLYTAACNMS